MLIMGFLLGNEVSKSKCLKELFSGLTKRPIHALNNKNKRVSNSQHNEVDLFV